MQALDIGIKQFKVVRLPAYCVQKQTDDVENPDFGLTTVFFAVEV